MRKHVWIVVSIGIMLSLAGLYASSETGRIEPTVRSNNEPVNEKVNIVLNPDLSNLLYDQTPDVYYALWSCQYDSILPFWSKIADDFTVPYEAMIDSVVWWGGYWNFGADTNYVIDFWIEIYPDSSGLNQPKQDPIYSERVGFTETFISQDYYIYSAVIPAFHAYPADTYWVVFQATLLYQPQWGNNGTGYPAWGNGQQCYFKSDYFGYPLWTMTSASLGTPIEIGFQIYGTATDIEEGTGPAKLSNFGFAPNMATIVKNRTAITYSTTSSGNVSLSVFDHAGRLVRSLVNARESAGTKTVYWDNRDDRDARLPNGVYFLKLEAQQDRAVHKLIFVE